MSQLGYKPQIRQNKVVTKYLPHLLENPQRHVGPLSLPMMQPIKYNFGIHHFAVLIPASTLRGNKQNCRLNHPSPEIQLSEKRVELMQKNRIK